MIRLPGAVVLSVQWNFCAWRICVSCNTGALWRSFTMQRATHHLATVNIAYRIVLKITPIFCTADWGYRFWMRFIMLATWLFYSEVVSQRYNVSWANGGTAFSPTADTKLGMIENRFWIIFIILVLGLWLALGLGLGLCIIPAIWRFWSEMASQRHSVWESSSAAFCTGTAGVMVIGLGLRVRIRIRVRAMHHPGYLKILIWNGITTPFCLRK